MQRDPLRLWVSQNIHTLAFLGAYFVTVVAGNLIFASPWRHSSLAISNSSDRFLSYPNTFTFGYWALLLCPFVLTPLIVSLTRRLSAPLMGRLARSLPEFSRVEFAVITVALFGLIIYQFWAADVMGIFSRGTDFTSSVEARFGIRQRLGFITLIPLQAVLPLIALYALIRWIQSSEWFWASFTIVTTLVLSVLLILINMKWPVLLFYIGMVMAIFIYARQHAYLKMALGAVFVFGAFVVISAFVFRVAPPPAQASWAEAVQTADPFVNRESRPTTGDPLAQASKQFVSATKAAPFYVPNLLVIALNRMAISYPYYYQVFTAEGPVCGGILSQATREPICRPSELIYSRIFIDDHFKNRGTSPLAVHISGYALGGWPIALVALLAASVILGLFAALPLDLGAAVGTLTIVGAQTAYHLSQIPGEGIVFYEHGLLWPGLLFLLYMGWRRVRAGRRQVAKPATGDYLQELTKASR
jgi:hypothetical protein